MSRCFEVTAFPDCICSLSLANSVIFAEPGSSDPTMTADIHTRANQSATRGGTSRPPIEIGLVLAGSLRSNVNTTLTIDHRYSLAELRKFSEESRCSGRSFRVPWYANRGHYQQEPCTARVKHGNTYYPVNSSALTVLNLASAIVMSATRRSAGIATYVRIPVHY
jgi:hypothetical protein